MSEHIQSRREFVRMVAGLMGSTVVEAKMECLSAYATRITLDTRGRTGPLIQMIEVIVPIEMPLELIVDANCTDRFYAAAMYSSAEPECVAIEDWESLREGHPPLDMLAPGAVLDLSYFSDEEAPLVPFDIGVLGGCSKEHPRGDISMRMLLRNLTDSPHPLLLAISGQVLSAFGCRFTADGPLYKSDLSGVIETETFEHSEPDETVEPS